MGGRIAGVSGPSPCGSPWRSSYEGQAWWEEEGHNRIAILIRLWDDGVTTAEIGKQLGCTKNAVIGKVRRLGLEMRVKPPVKPIPASIRAVQQLDGHSCAWPIGHPTDNDFHFCGAPALPKKSYCDKHQKTAVAKRKELVAAE